MGFIDDLLPEFDLEMTTTRKVIERAPTEKGEWKPHPKSFALAHLTQLVATMPGWLTNALRETELDLASGSGYSFESTQTLVDTFDAKVREAREAIAATRDEDLMTVWTLKNGDQVLWSAPRKTVVRSHINHLVHHRGQLSVYLRLLDVPVPSIYGPSADEKW